MSVVFGYSEQSLFSVKQKTEKDFTIMQLYGNSNNNIELISAPLLHNNVERRNWRLRCELVNNNDVDLTYDTEFLLKNSVNGLEPNKTVGVMTGSILHQHSTVYIDIDIMELISGETGDWATISYILNYKEANTNNPHDLDIENLRLYESIDRRLPNVQLPDDGIFQMDESGLPQLLYSGEYSLVQNFFRVKKDNNALWGITKSKYKETGGLVIIKSYDDNIFLSLFIS